MTPAAAHSHRRPLRFQSARAAAKRRAPLFLGRAYWTPSSSGLSDRCHRCHRCLASAIFAFAHCYWPVPRRSFNQHELGVATLLPPRAGRLLELLTAFHCSRHVRSAKREAVTQSAAQPEQSFTHSLSHSASHHLHVPSCQLTYPPHGPSRAPLAARRVADTQPSLSCAASVKVVGRELPASDAVPCGCRIAPPKRRDMSPRVTARQGPTHRRLVAHPCPAIRPTATAIVVHRGPQAWGNQIMVVLGWLKPRCFCVPNALT